MLDFRFRLSDRGEFYITGSAAKTSAAFDALAMAFAPDVPTSFFPDGLPGPGPDPTTPLPDADYDFTQVHEYSNLEYLELRGTLGFNYELSKSVGMFASWSLFDLEDKQPYLQDTNGSVSLLAGGFTWSF